MVFPKTVMRMKELQDMGFPREYLFRIYRTRGQRVAFKQNPARKTSPILFDTEELQKVMDTEREQENRSILRGGIPCIGGMK